jgi:hypothetical protein
VGRRWQRPSAAVLVRRIIWYDHVHVCVSSLLAGVCYRLFPSRMWARLQAQQPPEVLRVPLQQLCLTTKAALRAALGEGKHASLRILGTPIIGDSTALHSVACVGVALVMM